MSKTRSKMMTVLLLGLVGVLLVGLSVTTSPAQSVAVRFAYQTHVFQTPQIVAWKQGWYQEALSKKGYSLEMRAFPTGPPIVEGFVSGNIDMATIGTAVTVNAIGKGVPIRILASVTQDGESIMLRKGSPLRGIGEFKGKTIAIPAKGSQQDWVIRKALIDVGLNPNQDVRFVEMSGPDMQTALLRGDIDVAVLYEPITAQLLLGGQAEMLMSGREVLPDHDNDELVVSAGFLSKHPDAARAIVEQTVRAIRYAMDNQDEADEIAAKELGLTKDVVRKAHATYSRRRSGQPGERSIQAFADALFSWGYVKQRVTVAPHIDVGFLPK